MFQSLGKCGHHYVKVIINSLEGKRRYRSSLSCLVFLYRTLHYLPSPPSSSTHHRHAQSPDKYFTLILKEIDPQIVMPRLDIAVIGSGPCALAFVSRLAAPPGAIDFSADFLYGFDSETESLQTTIGRLNALKKSMSTSSNDHPLQGRVKVFEKSGAWLGKWDGLFDALGIQHLRSPHVAHPCPTHTHAILALAEMTKTVPGSKCEREIFADFKHLRYSGCHRAPSVRLFRSLCSHLCKSLGLDSLLEEGMEQIEQILTWFHECSTSFTY